MSQELGPNQRKWVEALRSGEYRQGKDWLCKEGQHCCLGVGCQLFLGDPLNPDSTCSPKTWGRDLENQKAPKELMDALSLRTRYGTGCDGLSLIGFNDDGKTFAEIAELIESDPANWFTEPK